jgi:hypothetical protein
MANGSSSFGMVIETSQAARESGCASVEVYFKNGAKKPK